MEIYRGDEIYDIRPVEKVILKFKQERGTEKKGKKTFVYPN